MQEQIHLIWFGAPLSERNNGENFTRLIRLAHQNPECEVNLWTDNGTNEAISKLKLEGLLVPSNLKIKIFDSEFKDEKSDLLIKSKKLVDNMKSFDENSKANYGAASDLARAMILYREGGLYLDLDTEINDGLECKPLPLSEWVKAGVVKLGCGQGNTIADKPSNDMIFSPKQHHQSMELYMKLYTGCLTGEKLQKIKGPDSKDTTVQFGPILMRSCVLNNPDTIMSANYKSNTFIDYDKLNDQLKEESEKYKETEAQQNSILPADQLIRRQSNSWMEIKTTTPLYYVKQKEEERLNSDEITTVQKKRVMLSTDLASSRRESAQSTNSVLYLTYITDSSKLKKEASGYSISESDLDKYGGDNEKQIYENKLTENDWLYVRCTEIQAKTINKDKKIPANMVLTTITPTDFRPVNDEDKYLIKIKVREDNKMVRNKEKEDEWFSSETTEIQEAAMYTYNFKGKATEQPKYPSVICPNVQTKFYNIYTNNAPKLKDVRARSISSERQITTMPEKIFGENTKGQIDENKSMDEYKLTAVGLAKLKSSPGFEWKAPCGTDLIEIKTVVLSGKPMQSEMKNIVTAEIKYGKNGAELNQKEIAIDANVPTERKNGCC